MSSDTSSLHLSWLPPSGDWDNYSVVLMNGSEILLNESISKLRRQLVISTSSLGLMPGRLYNAGLTVHSGILESSVHCSTWIGQLPFTPFYLILTFIIIIVVILNYHHYHHYYY